MMIVPQAKGAAYIKHSYLKIIEPNNNPLTNPIGTMNKLDALTLAAPTQHLQQLTTIRTLLLSCLWLSLLLSTTSSNIHVLYSHIIVILTAFSVFHGLTFFRIRKTLMVTEIEFFIHLLIDVGFLNVLLFYSGGANNPFISYFLVPICISAATLPWRYTWLITSSCIISYSCLLFLYIPLPLFNITTHHNEAGLNWHILGMWLNFFISAILITYFVVKMAQTLRRKDTALTLLREDELRNEQVVAIATLAASAAHDINTPLSTMTVLLSELRNDYKHNTTLLDDLNLLTQQVDYCSSTLKQLSHDASEFSHGQLKQKPAQEFCNSIINRWQLLRPSIYSKINMQHTNQDTLITIDPCIDYAIINLLNNAADASPNNVIVNVSWSNELLTWKIIDSGEGIEEQLQTNLGKKSNTTKQQGLGICLLLTHATIKRYGGSVSQTPNLPKGTITSVTLPLNIARKGG